MLNALQGRYVMGKKSSQVQTVLKGMGGAFLGAIAAKIASDIYDAIKRRYLASGAGDGDERAS